MEDCVKDFTPPFRTVNKKTARSFISTLYSVKGKDVVACVESLLAHGIKIKNSGILNSETVKKRDNKVRDKNPSLMRRNSKKTAQESIGNTAFRSGKVKKAVPYVEPLQAHGTQIEDSEVLNREQLKIISTLPMDRLKDYFGKIRKLS